MLWLLMLWLLMLWLVVVVLLMGKVKVRVVVGGRGRLVMLRRGGLACRRRRLGLGRVPRARGGGDGVLAGESLFFFSFSFLPLYSFSFACLGLWPFFFGYLTSPHSPTPFPFYFI